MKLLVTGGLGFIGSNFIRLHLQSFPDDPILNLDKITYAGNPENLKDVESNPRYQFQKGDIADSDFVQEIFHGFQPDVVVNFAAESHVDRSILSSADFIRTNVVGTQTLLDAARAKGVTRFLQVSTDEVYGSLGPTGFFTEQTPLNPGNPYSASKAGADLLCLSYFNTYRFPILISRCGNNYGPFQFPEKLIPLMILNALQDQGLPIYGDGGNIRDWIHVEDHAKALEVILRKGEVGQVYNVGAENERTNLSVAKTLLDLLGKPHSLLQFVKDRPGHDRRYATDSEKLKKLGWTPQIHFEEGLQKTLQWYRDNSQWLTHLKNRDFQDYLKIQYGRRTSVPSPSMGEG